MIQVLRTAAFDEWLQGLRDKVAKKQILARLTRLSLGNWGDCKPAGVKSLNYALVAALATAFTVGVAVRS